MCTMRKICIHSVLFLFLYCFRLEETKEELEEYQISSRELEAELEAQLKQLEKRNKELETNSARLQTEVESLRVSIIFQNNL